MGISCFSLFSGAKTLATFRVGQLRAETNLTMTGSTFRFFIKLNRIYNSVIITLFLQVSHSDPALRPEITFLQFRHSSSGSSST